MHADLYFALNQMGISNYLEDEKYTRISKYLKISNGAKNQ